MPYSYLFTKQPHYDFSMVKLQCLQYLQGKTLLYEGGKALHSIRPVVGYKEVRKMTTGRGSKLNAKIVTLSAVSSEVIVEAVEQCKTACIRLPHVLKSS